MEIAMFALGYVDTCLSSMLCSIGIDDPKMKAINKEILTGMEGARVIGQCNEFKSIH